MEYTILIAEDECDIVNLLSLYLKSNGYRVMTADNGMDAFQMVQTIHIDLALLDIMMPGMDGYELTRKIRTISNMPILFLSAKDQEQDKILGLTIGADAYLTKPFNPLEVLATIACHLRRFYELGSAPREDSMKKICVGELLLDLEEMTLTKNKIPIFLTSTEYKIIAKLMKTPGRVYAKSQLYESINGEFFESDDKTMMV
ncbi:MAG: response regulator transcription factor, partial [Lachnospiraceae bacterium]